MLALDWQSFDVLVVDDEEDNLDAFRFAFRRSFNVHYALGGLAALAELERIDPAVVVSDQRMPGMSGIELLTRAKERRPDTVGILLTAYADLSVLIDAVNSGAVERYVQKPWDSKELTVILRQAISSFATVRENRRLREQLAHYAGYLEREQRDPIDFGEIAGGAAGMTEVSARIAEVAPTASPVLIESEDGSEKDVVARSIHVGSPREERPFVKVTCAAFRGEALQRELFGWRRGAFDGAFDDRAGRFEVANGGTLYLDEPRALSPEVQARILRALERGEVERVGESEPIAVDVRLVVSISPGLEEAYAGHELLPDLASRLSVFPIRLPPLRDRLGDVPALAAHFLRKYARRNARAATSLASASLGKLEAYAWPGNVRELENVIERAAILARGEIIHPEHLAFGGRAPAPPSPIALPSDPGTLTGSKADLDSQLDEIERRELLAALARCSGNKAEVARSLGVQRTTLYYRLKRLGIET
jgi:two-component system response regulator AtoC